MDAQWDSPTRDDGFRTPAPDSVAASSSSENCTVLRRTRPARLDIPISNSLTFGFSVYCKRGTREYMEEDNLCGEHKLVTKFYFSTFFFEKLNFVWLVLILVCFCELGLWQVWNFLSEFDYLGLNHLIGEFEEFVFFWGGSGWFCQVMNL